MKIKAEIGDYIRCYRNSYEGEETFEMYCSKKGEVEIADGTPVMIGEDRFTFYNILPGSAPKNAITADILMNDDWIYIPPF